MRKMSRVVEKVNGHAAGLDVHKNQITYCVLDRKGCEVAADGMITWDGVFIVTGGLGKLRPMVVLTRPGKWTLEGYRQGHRSARVYVTLEAGRLTRAVLRLRADPEAKSDDWSRTPRNQTEDMFR